MQAARLLKYHHILNRSDRRYLLKYGYINGCGGKGGIDFSEFMESAIKTLKGFDIKYFIDLKNDLEKFCTEHDIDFSLGGTMIDFYKANFSFSYNIFKLLKWKKNGKKIYNFLGRFFILITMFFLLNKYGKRYFKFGKKKKLEDLFIDFNPNNY